jgi:hypothetical protein
MFNKGIKGGKGRYKSSLITNSVEDADIGAAEKFVDWCTGVLNSPGLRHRLVEVAMGRAEGVKVADSLRALEILAAYGSTKPMSRSLNTSVSVDLGNLSTKELAQRAYKLIKEMGLDTGEEKVREVIEMKEALSGPEDTGAEKSVGSEGDLGSVKELDRRRPAEAYIGKRDVQGT